MMGSGSRFDPLGGQEETVWTQSGRTVVACAPSAADVAWHNGRFRTDRCTVATPPTTGFVFLAAEADDDSSKAAEPGSLLCAARDFGLAGHRHVTPPSPCPPTLHTARGCPRRLWDAAKAGLLLPTRGKSSWSMQRPRIHKSRVATSTRPR